MFPLCPAPILTMHQGEGDAPMTRPKTDLRYPPPTDIRISTFQEEPLRDDFRLQVALVASLVAAALAIVCLAVTACTYITIRRHLAGSCRRADTPAGEQRCSIAAWKIHHNDRPVSLVATELDVEKGHFQPTHVVRSPQTERVMYSPHAWHGPQYPQTTRASPLTRRDTDVSQLSGQTWLVSRSPNSDSDNADSEAIA